jgi:hypothetical protein
VSLQSDPELVWVLGRGAKTITPEEAAITLTKTQEDFWASKQGLKLNSRSRGQDVCRIYLARSDEDAR